MTNGHGADRARLPVNSIDNPKTPHAILPQPLQFAKERLAALRGGNNRAHGCFDGPFEVGMERADDAGNMGRNVRPERSHARRRFLGSASGSPNTSSKMNPCLRAL